MHRPNLLHVIIALSPGGTEYKLSNLIIDTKQYFNHTLLVLTSSKPEFKDRLNRNGIDVIDLNIHKVNNLLNCLLILRKKVKGLDVDLIVSWLYHSNMISLFFKKYFFSKAKLIWNIRSSMSSYAHAPLHRKVVIFISKLFSEKVDTVVYNSRVSLNEHVTHGFKNKNNLVIGNGVDTNIFKFDSTAKERLCEELGINSKNILIGMCARYHQVKNHILLIKAFSELVEKGYKAKCVLSGDGISYENPHIWNAIHASGNKENFFLLDHRDDINFIYSALDIHVLASNSESSSNAVMEALSCGTKCVSSNVGNSAEILPKKCLFEKNNQKELVDKMIALIDQDHEDLSAEKLRNEIITKHNLSAMTEKYRKLYTNIVRQTY